MSRANPSVIDPRCVDLLPTEQALSHSVHIDIYGYKAVVRSSCASVVDDLAEDFAFFAGSASADSHVLDLFESEPPYSDLPLVEASVYTPRNVSYRDGDVTFVDYSGRALGIHDRLTGHFRLYSLDRDLLYEAAYLFLLSQSGEALDSGHLHRVHALAVSLNGFAALVLLPMGGGKSTLGSQLLAYPQISLLSDDSPLIDRDSNVYAFPLRIGLLPGSEVDIPPEQMRRIQRMEFGPKLLVNYSYFADRVVARAAPCLLLLGHRSLRETCGVRPASMLSAMKALLANCVIGVGLFQGLEFVLQRGWKDVFKKGGTGWSRLRSSVRLMRRSQVLHLSLGRDHKENARVVFNLLMTAAQSSSKL